MGNRKNENEKPMQFPVSDLALNTALACEGIFPSTVDRKDPRRIAFLYQDTYEFQKTVESFWNRSLLIEPQTFYQNLKIIKARIYADREGR